MLLINKMVGCRMVQNFLKDEKGNIIIPFAIMLPAIAVCLIYAINTAYTLKSRALTSEASNEASLAVVAINNKNSTLENIETNKNISLNYIHYYLTKDMDITDLNTDNIVVNYNDLNKTYNVSYQQDVNLIVNLNNVDTMTVTNRSDSYGNTRKDPIIQSIDFGFVVDFSGSNTCNYNDTSCNEYLNNSAGSDIQRIDYTKRALSDIISTFKDYSSDIKFAFVPYDIGVPVSNEEQNLAGGDSYACSINYKLKEPFNQVDYNFWANKNMIFSRWFNLKKSGAITNYLDYEYFPKQANTIYYYLDFYNYRYYSQIVGPALGYVNDSELLNNQICEVKYATDSINLGAYIYACGEQQPDYPLSVNNRPVVESQYAKMVQVYDYMYSGNYNTHTSFANSETVDIEGTINTLFSHQNENLITFTRPIAPTTADYTPFMGMCQSPLYSNNIMVGGDENLSTIQLLDNSITNISSFQSSPHLVELTSDTNQLASYLTNNHWRPGGGTDTMTGLLRTVPVMAKSDAANKIMIIISDGKDDTGADKLRDDFLDKGICKSITNGLTSKIFESQGYISKAARNSAIHYIKLDPAAAALNPNTSTDAEYESVYGKWYTDCMNKDRNLLHGAVNYDSLLNVAQYILISETGVFVTQ